MRSKLVVAWAIGCAALGGCRFDRSPLSSRTSANGVATDGAVGLGSDAQPENSPNTAGSGDGEAGTTVIVADAAVTDALTADSGAGFVDDASTTSPPAVPPPSGGLVCGGSFCAFGLDPEKPCCTTAADVTSRAARGTDLCGLDLSALPGSPYGQHCWQRDQLGIVDDRCLPRNEDVGVSAEPGCCGDDGTCGTLNADHKLGCRHESGAAPQPCAMEPVKATCDPTGTFGLWTTVDATWGGRSGGLWDLTDDGRGAIEVYLLVKISSVDPTTLRIDATGRVCGVRLPAFFSTTLCEAYQPNFPVEIWESSKVPGLILGGRYECAAAGCVLSIDPLTYLLGFDLNNPEAPWPRADTVSQLRCPSGRGEDCFPDDDDDGRPGVAVTLTTTGTASGRACGGRYTYRGTPLSESPAAIFNGVRRADRLQLGVRTKLGSSMRWADKCDRAQGSALAEYVNSRAVGCLVQRGTYTFPNAGPAGDNEACDATEVGFLDENLPVYRVLAAGQVPSSALQLQDVRPSRGPEVRAVRLGDLSAAVGCAEVRDAKY